ncbi:hypothetical protein [Pseudomonas aeruginosa]|uniref:hypothetical protein n=1 Tax=Pseudomonas aeruginosa TaxID=287 RepID=UPI00128ED88A|nr:hypothetical protein [Pseudomonas aeruginosa]MDK8377643.1 hypothetical protein [Pseudomonas aeruginosa]MQH01582.1 hypothetical protein [Pseudomonas aeruginosa]
MSLETQIASLVGASNNLTGAVNGKMGQIDAKVAQAEARFDQNMELMKNRLPRLAVTRNFIMNPVAAGTYPEFFGFHQEISWSRIAQISNLSEAAGRPASDIALLAQIEADVKEQFPDFNIGKSSYYRSAFGVWQLAWSKLAEPQSSNYIAYPAAADGSQTLGVSSVPMNSYLTVGAFVKVVDGEIYSSWGSGSVKGKWRWCSVVMEPAAPFASYIHLHPKRASSSGVIQCALVGAATGVISHPNHWGAMMSLG